MAHVQSGLYRIVVDTQTGIRSIGKPVGNADKDVLITRPFDPEVVWEVVRIDNEKVILKVNGTVVSPNPADRSTLSTLPSDNSDEYQWVLKDLGEEQISSVRGLY